MTKATVYRYKVYDFTADDFVVSMDGYSIKD